MQRLWPSLIPPQWVFNSPKPIGQDNRQGPSLQSPQCWGEADLPVPHPPRASLPDPQTPQVSPPFETDPRPPREPARSSDPPEPISWDQGFPQSGRRPEVAGEG